MRGQNDDRKIFVDQRVRPVLHFACGIAFRVDVGNFLQFECAFEGNRVVNAAAEVEKIRVAEELPRQRLVKAGFVALQHGFDLVRNAREFLQQGLRGFAGQFAAHLAQMSGQQQQGGQLRGKSFRGCNANFRSRVRQDGSCRFAGDHRAHYIADRECRRALQLGFALPRQRVRGFTGLADAHRQGLAVQNGIAIAKLAAVIDFHLHAGQSLDHEFPSQARVPTRSAGYYAHLLEIAELLLGNLHVVEEDLSGVLRNAS